MNSQITIANGKKDKQMNVKPDKWANIVQMNKKTNGRTDKWTGRDMDKKDKLVHGQNIELMNRLKKSIK